MKKRCLGLLTITFVLVFVVSDLQTHGSLSTSQGHQAELIEALKQACQCSEPPSPPPLRTVIAPELDPAIVPVDVSTKENSACDKVPPTDCQRCFNCFAWQLFIALNWPAASPGEPDLTAGFGDPGNSTAVVWETFKTVDEIFNDPNLIDLPAWEQGNSTRVLSAVLKKKSRATLQADNHWLTDQKNKLVWYEIRVNQDEYQYIAAKHLYNQDGIYNAYTTSDGIRLPDSKSEYGKYGAIEIKAAFRLVPNGELDQYKAKYKISYARNNPSGDIVPIALVGLHIIKKTPHSPQFVWATFEHQDNAPEKSELTQDRKWSFYDPTKPVDYPNWNDPPKGSTPKNVPVQVTRVMPIRDDSKAINKAVKDLIADRFHQSVWLNYMLVDVQWPFDHPNLPFKETQMLPAGDPIPPYVANTTMETYMQLPRKGGQGVLDSRHPNDGPSSCIGCHRKAARTPTFSDPTRKGYWLTDYTTIFARAKAKGPVN